MNTMLRGGRWDGLPDGTRLHHRSFRGRHNRWRLKGCVPRRNAGRPWERTYDGKIQRVLLR